MARGRKLVAHPPAHLVLAHRRSECEATFRSCVSCGTADRAASPIRSRIELAEVGVPMYR